MKAPRQVSFFAWTVAWNKILTSDNMKNKGFDFVDWCFMCHYCREIVDHLLIIIIRLNSYGISSSNLLRFLRSYQKQFLIFCLIGEIS